MKAKELIALLEQYPEAEVTIVEGHDNCYDITEKNVWCNKDSDTGEMFIDINIQEEVYDLYQVS